MSQDDTSPRPMLKALDVEGILDKWVISGGIDLMRVKSEEFAAGSLKELYYTFTAEGGFSVCARIYWVYEDNRPRKYVWVECALGEFDGEPLDLLAHVLKKSREIPAAFKTGLYDKMITFGFRGPVDGFNLVYLSDLIEGIIPCSQTLFNEIKGPFNLVPWVEVIQRERSTKAH